MDDRQTIAATEQYSRTVATFYETWLRTIPPALGMWQREVRRTQETIRRALVRDGIVAPSRRDVEAMRLARRWRR